MIGGTSPFGRIWNLQIIALYSFGDGFIVTALYAESGMRCSMLGQFTRFWLECLRKRGLRSVRTEPRWRSA